MNNTNNIIEEQPKQSKQLSTGVIVGIIVGLLEKKFFKYLMLKKLMIKILRLFL